MNGQCITAAPSFNQPFFPPLFHVFFIRLNLFPFFSSISCNAGGVAAGGAGWCGLTGDLRPNTFLSWPIVSKRDMLSRGRPPHSNRSWPVIRVLGKMEELLLLLPGFA